MLRRFDSAPSPCLKCCEEELKQLHTYFRASGERFWVYRIGVPNCCNRCDTGGKRRFWNSYKNCPLVRSLCCLNPYDAVQIPIPVDIIGKIERALHSASTSSSGSAFRPHSNFIQQLATLDCDEVYKQALCCWAPVVMKAYIEGVPGVSRILRVGHQMNDPEIPPAVGYLEGSTSGPGAKTSATLKPTAAIPPLVEIATPPANEGTEDGMRGTNVAEDAFGVEKRVFGESYASPPKVLAHSIGPDLIPTECMSSSSSNLKAGLAKRVQPLGFKADKKMTRKINKTVDALLKNVFSVDKIKQWRVDNPVVEEFASSKWSPERFRNAFEDAMAETNARIEQTFQIKVNEALPAKGKAPRPIIQCGDRAQVMMSLPVKCFEDLLFEFFENASIKHLSKYDAMKRVSKHLRQLGAKLIEGDGSAWDSCCNPKIRSMTENRILKHIIAQLGNDPEVPKSWMDAVLADMEKAKIKGKAKVDDDCISPLRVLIEAIRQSGHRGTSCFNFLINLICWLCVLCEHPERMIKKMRDGELQSKYVSAFDGKEYFLKYAFEGDDSAISTTEDITQYQERIEELWTSLGFRMKLVFVEEKMTFTGFDFLCDQNGPTGVFVPEIARNIASSSWTTSSLVKQFPHRKSEVGTAAMYARAENFKDCGPLCAYFAALGLAHAELAGDREINSAEAKVLAVNVSPSVVTSLHELMDSAGVMDDDMRKLLEVVGVKFTPEQELALLRADFGNNPYDLQKARLLIPKEIWDPAHFDKPRR